MRVVVAGLSPFPRGQLQLRFAYNETVDTGAGARTRIYGPTLRWNIRPGTYLELAYSWNESTQPALATYGTSFTAALVVKLL